MRGSFLKSQKRGTKEGESKYTLRGQRAEKPLLLQFFDLMQDEQSIEIFGGEFKAMYQCGLVMNSSLEDCSYIRDSPDAVVMYKADGCDLRAIPVEVKGRVNANTFHRQREQITQFFVKNCNYEPRTSMMCSERAFRLRLKSSNPDLKDLVQGKKEMYQVLHHAVTFNPLEEHTGYLLIGDQRKLFAVLGIVFEKRLLDAYKTVLRFCFKNTTALNFAFKKCTGDKMPEIPQVVFDAFNKSKKLKKLKMTEESYRSFFGLWKRLQNELDVYGEIELERDPHHGEAYISFPLPRVARIVPGNVSSWNSLKPGVDTCTKHIDSCQEQISDRTENNVAVARILMYYAIVVHKYKQMLTAKDDLDSYPTLHHYRDAANHRTSFKQSIQLFRKTLFKNDDEYIYGDEEERKQAVPLGAFAPTPAAVDADGEDDDGEEVQVQRRKEENSASDSSESNISDDEIETIDAPTHYAMPHAAAKTGKSPDTKGRSVDNMEPRVLARCNNCIGVYMAQMIKGEPEEENDGGDGYVTDDSLLETTKKTKKPRKTCCVCKRKVDIRCHGCRRWMCFKPPKLPVVRQIKKPKKSKKGKKGKGKKGKKKRKKKKTVHINYPKTFYVDTPLLNDDGSIKTDEATGEVKYEREYGYYTCYHIAHRKLWKQHLLKQQNEMIAEIQQLEEEAKAKKELAEAEAKAKAATRRSKKRHRKS
jgi:hypothetical protein